MLGRCLCGNGETESERARSCTSREERVEDAPSDFRRHARTGIGDHESDHAARLGEMDVQLAGWCRGKRLLRVGEQIQHGLLKVAPVSADGEPLQGQLPTDRNP